LSGMSFIVSHSPQSRGSPATQHRLQLVASASLSNLGRS
jgi:hypothetical protein